MFGGWDSIETLFYSAKKVVLFSSGSFLGGLFNLSLYFLNGSFSGSLSLSLWSRSVLGNNLYGNYYLNFLVEVNHSLVVAQALSFAHGDNLALNLDALFSESLYHLRSTYRAIELAGNGNLCRDNELYALESLSLVLGSSLQSSELMSLLAHILGENLAC